MKIQTFFTCTHSEKWCFDGTDCAVLWRTNIVLERQIHHWFKTKACIEGPKAVTGFVLHPVVLSVPCTSPQTGFCIGFFLLFTATFTCYGHTSLQLFLKKTRTDCLQIYQNASDIIFLGYSVNKSDYFILLLYRSSKPRKFPDLETAEFLWWLFNFCFFGLWRDNGKTVDRLKSVLIGLTSSSPQKMTKYLASL